MRINHQRAGAEGAVFRGGTTVRIKVERCAPGSEAVRQRRSDGRGCIYAFRICCRVVSEVGFCTNCQPMRAAGLGWGLSLSPSLTSVGRMRLFLFFYEKQMSPDRFFFDARSSANSSERKSDYIPIPSQRGCIENKYTVWWREVGFLRELAFNCVYLTLVIAGVALMRAVKWRVDNKEFPNI